MSEDEIRRALLRHALATLAYRAAKVLRSAPASFAEFKVGATTRSSGEILAHLCDLMDWGTATAEGREVWRDTTTDSWESGVDRFFTAVARFDAALDAPIPCPCEKLLQGPIADALTHVGQLAMLRRLAEAPVRGENYLKAEITTGRVGKDQPPPVSEFD